MSDRPVAAGKSSFDVIDTARTLALLDVRPRSTCVDLACGVGNYSVEIAKIIGDKGRMYAVDLWQEGISILDQKIDKNGIRNIETIVLDICKPLPFDTTFLINDVNCIIQ